MKLRDAIKQDMEKMQMSADDLKDMMVKMDPQTRSRMQNDVNTIRDSMNDIRSMLQQAGDQEVKK